MSRHLVSENITDSQKIPRQREIPGCFPATEIMLSVTERNLPDPSNNYRNLVVKFLDDHQFMIDIDGNLSKRHELSQCDIFDFTNRDRTEKNKYKIKLLNLMGLVMVGVIAHIIRKIPYCPVTVIGTTFYSRIISVCMSKHNIPHMMCKSTNRVIYYSTENGYEIPFDGPSPYFSTDSKKEIIPVIPHSSDELKNLENHTKLENLSDIQENILSGFHTQDGIYFYRSGDFVCDNDKLKNPITMIKRCFGNLYYIITSTDVWLSRFIVSDIVLPLQPTETVSCLSGKVSDSTNKSTDKEYYIRRSINKCTIRESEITTKLFRYSGYYVNLDLTIKAIRDVGLEYDECLFYSLDRPRPFSQGPLYVVHPYHLPPTWDPFLSIMIVIYAIFKDLRVKSS